MIGYIGRRILMTLPVLAVVMVIVFLLAHLGPGDPAVIIAGDLATTAQIESIRSQLGLDQPLLTQFVGWLGRVLRGDLGTSIFSHRPVTELILQRVEPTLALAGLTMLFSVILAVPIGVLAAWRVGRWTDRVLMAVAVLGFSMPVFVLGYVMVYVFSAKLGWFPVQGYSPLEKGLLPFLRHLTLPAIAIGSTFLALISRVTRAAMLEVLNEDYVRTAYAKGLATRTVLLLHALKNAAVPIITVIGVGFGVLISGVVVTESVFAIPGIGRLTVDAIMRRDFPVIQGVVLVMSAMYVLINLLVDIAYTFVDPRIRY
ncbi:MAG TPA: ABC transporter permease [Geminicoccaceae bacterium]|nr:ABC transporter permease [Geminicoccus sp.]HMU48525.1 ABC transporter permease [Geminicoccaceae bacterium]